MDSHTRLWIDASKTSLNSIFKSLQKREVGLPVKTPLCDALDDKLAKDFWGYSRPSFSKDHRLLKHLKARGMDKLTFQTTDDGDFSMTEVHYNDMLLNSSNSHFKSLFKTMDHFGGR